jgi:hypothetical protein
VALPELAMTKAPFGAPLLPSVRFTLTEPPVWLMLPPDELLPTLIVAAGTVSVGSMAVPSGTLSVAPPWTFRRLGNLTAPFTVTLALIVTVVLVSPTISVRLVRTAQVCGCVAVTASASQRSSVVPASPRLIPRLPSESVEAGVLPIFTGAAGSSTLIPPHVFDAARLLVQLAAVLTVASQTPSSVLPGAVVVQLLPRSRLSLLSAL